MSKPICGYIKVGDFEGGSADAQHTGWSEIIGLNAAVERKTGSFIKSDNPVGSTSLDSPAWWLVIYPVQCLRCQRVLATA